MKAKVSTLAIFLSGPSPASFSFILELFETTCNTIFGNKLCEKCTTSSIRQLDTNSQPLDYKSPTTTQELYYISQVKGPKALY